MREVVIVSAVRTPIGSFGGSYKNYSAVDLGITCAKEAIKRANIEPSEIDDVYLGCVLQAGQKQGVARQVAVGAGIPVEVPATTINIICGSGLRTVSLATQIIALGDADVILCGGTENMSMAPYVIPSARYGARMGSTVMLDHMVNEGLTDAFNDYHMGITAENVAEKWGITRQQQDEFAVLSQNKAEKAQKDGKFDEEIVPVVIKTKKGETVVDKDEYIKYGATVETLAKLRPAFKKDGLVTAGNASGINDGAAMLILMSKEKAQEKGLEILATVKGYDTAGIDPTIMGAAPINSIPKALKKANWKLEDVELFELNEAFASQSLAIVKELGIDPNKVNVNGGAIALGHPIGASGARILVTLLHAMKDRGAKKGLATLCIGGGMATTLLVERE